MAAATYSIQYTDADGKKQTLKGVSDVKAMEKHIKSQGGSDIVVLKGAKSADNTPVDADPDPSTPDDSEEPVDSEDAEPADAADDSAPATPAKKGAVPAGLAKYLASKKGK